MILISVFLRLSAAANWAQLAGPRKQNVATPYMPQSNYENADEAARPMWSARWGHVATVFNDTTPRDDFSIDENSARLLGLRPKLLVLGGDDRVLDNHIFSEEEAKGGMFGEEQEDGVVGGPSAHGLFLNDVWWSEPPIGSQAECKSVMILDNIFCQLICL